MRIIRHLLCLGLLAAGAQAIAADETGCGHTLQSVPHSIQDILGPLYADAAPDDKLKDAHRRLELLMLEAAHCKMSAQSMTRRSTEAEQDLAEWQSLDQWLYRLVNFVGLNAKGDQSIDWKREYETFVEVYELKI